MKISLDWLGDLVSWEDTPEELAVKLTAAGLNVESIEEYNQTFPGVVIAKVVHRQQHPDADRLSVCQVTDGGDPVTVVCGAPNVTAGMKTPFAKPGVKLPDGMKLRKAKIRGVESNGMLCSATELGLGDEADVIM